MATESKHIIRKAFLGIHKKNTGNAFRVQEETVSWWNSDLLPAIERELENFSSISDTIIIPKLDIVVDAAAEHNWQTTVLPLILNNLRQQLGDKIPSALFHDKPVSSFMLSQGDKEVRLSSSRHFATVLGSYLSTGVLPWHTGLKKKEDFIYRLQELSKTEVAVLREHLQPILKDNKAAQQRLVYLLSGSSLAADELYILLFPAHTALVAFVEITRLLQRLEKLNSEKLNAINIELTALLFNSAETIETDFTELFQSVVGPFYLTEGIELSINKTINLPKPYNSIIAGIISSKTSEESSQKMDSLSQQITEEIKSDNHIEIPAEKTETTKGEIKNAEEIATILKTDGIYISNAGLILTAPFLNMLFEKTGLVKDYKILDIDKAVCLAGYIASGNTAQAEFELLLPKILCGVPAETVIDTSVILPQEIVSEADNMLASLIEHWSVLGSTSIDGLRGSFLIRDGKLTFRNNEWLLQVEQKAYDMLLQQIPWNYQWIKLPWMPYLLRTEWVS